MRKTLLAAALLAASIVAGAALFMGNHPSRVPPGGTQGPGRSLSIDLRTSQTESDAAPGEQATATTSNPVSPAEPREIAGPLRREVVSEESGSRVEIVRVPRDQALARVNGVVITLNDLVPIGEAKAKAEEVMSPELYDFLLNHAIERELTLQAASREGVDLTEEERHERERIREAMLARAGRGAEGVTLLNVQGTLEERIEFEMRDVTSQLLLASLLAREGAPSPHVTDEQVRKYYREHLDQYPSVEASDPPERNTAWQEIDLDIRGKLAPACQAKYQESRRKLLDQLRAEASITVVAIK